MRLYRRCDCPAGAECAHPWHYKFEHEGRCYRGTTRLSNRHQAERVAVTKQAAAYAHGAGLTKRQAPRLSVHAADYLQWARAHHPATAGLIDAAVLPRLLAVVGDKRVDQVTPFDLDRWRQARLQDGVQRSTVDREYHVVQSCFTLAVDRGRLATSPCAKVTPWKLEEKRRRVLASDELKRALEGLPARYALMCRVTLECLPRLSEVLTLTRADLGPDWLLRRLKGGARLRVGITPALAADLRRQLVTPNQVYVFGDPPPRQETTSSYFTVLFRKLGLAGVSHHAMRHTGVTLMLDAGRNPQAIQRLAGWSSLRMLERYGHVRDAEMLHAVAGNAAYLQRVLA